MIPTLQYYKYLYAIRLIDLGLANEALHYLEEIASHILKRPGKTISLKWQKTGLSYLATGRNVNNVQVAFL